jgi:hypothetical protein
MKKGRGESKDSRRITMSVTAAVSPNESNWGRRGGCLGFLVYLFSAATSQEGGKCLSFLAGGGGMDSGLKGTVQ